MGNKITDKEFLVYSCIREFYIEYTYENRTEFFNSPYLDNVDQHPQVVIDSLIEEASEMIKALMEIKKLTKNKISISQFSIGEHSVMITPIINL